MNIKKIISLCLAVIICMGIFIVPVTHAETNEVNLEKLYAFDILDNSDSDLSRPVTRIEMVKYTMALLGNNTYSSQSTPYSDVTEEHIYSGAVNNAYALGIISPAATFNPERTVKYQEAVKMVVAALGYADAAENRGGYHGGYVGVALEIGLLKNVNAKENEDLTLLNVAQLLENALSTKVCNNSYVIDKPGELKSLYNSLGDDQTVLNLYLKTSKYKVFVADLTSSSMKAELIKKDENNKYEVGDILNLTVTNYSSLADCRYTYSNIYVNDNDEVVYAEIDKNIDVFIGHIYEVNESHNSAAQNPSYIHNIGFEDTEDYIDVSEECQMFFNGSAVKGNKVYPYIGAFARAVIYNDEIIALEAWDLSEGGIVKSVTDNEIQYIKGITPVSTISNIGSYKELTIYINGLKSELWALTGEMIFDWYESENKESLMIVASSRIIADELGAISDDGLEIGGDLYPLSEKYDIYCSTDGEKYKNTSDFSALFGRTIKAYIDFAGYVRYAKPILDDELSKEYFALITGIEENQYSNSELLMYVFKGDTVEKSVYTLSEIFEKKNTALIEHIKAEAREFASADTASKNDAIKGADLCYKVVINSENEVVKITVPTRFSEPTLDDRYESGTDGLLFSSTFPISNTPHIPSPKIKFPDAKICAFYYSADEGMQVRLIGWSDLTGRDCTGILITPFAEYRSSKIDFLLIRGDVETLKVTRADYVKSGFCTAIRKGYDAENEKDYLILTVDGKEYVSSKYKNMFESVKDAAYIIYSEGNSLTKENEIVPVTIYNLSGLPENWTLSAARKNGLHRDEIDFIDSERIYFKSGDKWYFDKNADVYELVESNGKVKFVPSHRGNVPEGADCWYIYQDSEARMLFFVR